MLPKKHTGHVYLYTEKYEYLNIFSSYKEIAKMLDMSDSEVYDAIDTRTAIGKFKNFLVKTQKINLIDSEGKPFSY